MLVGTDKFRVVIEAMSRIGGLPGVRWATVSHPLGSATPEVLAERADEALAQFVEIVVTDPES